MTQTRTETLRTEVDALREENEQLREKLDERKSALQLLQETLQRREQEMELARFRAVEEERRKWEEKEARFLWLLERQQSGPGSVRLFRLKMRT